MIMQCGESRVQGNMNEWREWLKKSRAFQHGLNYHWRYTKHQLAWRIMRDRKDCCIDNNQYLTVNQKMLMDGNNRNEVASPTPGTGIKSCGCYLPVLTKFTF